MSTQLLSSADVADRLRVNIRTAQRIIRSIPHVNIGTGKKNEHLRVTEEQLQAYIEERTILPSLPRLSNVNPRIIPRKRAAGTTTIPRRPLNQK